MLKGTALPFKTMGMLISLRYVDISNDYTVQIDLLSLVIPRLGVASGRMSYNLDLTIWSRDADALLTLMI